MGIPETLGFPGVVAIVCVLRTVATRSSSRFATAKDPRRAQLNTVARIADSAICRSSSQHSFLVSLCAVRSCILDNIQSDSGSQIRVLH